MGRLRLTTATRPALRCGVVYYELMQGDTPRVIKWSESERERRAFDLLENWYGPLPDNHLEAIASVHQDDRGQLSRWFYNAVQMNGGDMLVYPHIETLNYQQPVPSEKKLEWLHRRGIPYSTQVYAFTSDEYDRILVMPWRILLKYWEGLADCAGYSLIVTDQRAQWACLFHHEQVIQFGSFKPMGVATGGN